MGKRDLKKDKQVFFKHKRKKTRKSRSSSSSSSSCFSFDEEIKRKLKKKLKKIRRKEKLKKKKKEKKNFKKLIKSKVKEILNDPKNSETLTTSFCDIDDNLMKKSKSLTPMTKDEWEKQQNTFKRVFDEETGRMRLIKGTGEIVEECVSRERHLAINKQSTRGDGEFFQRKMSEYIK